MVVQATTIIPVELYGVGALLPAGQGKNWEIGRRARQHPEQPDQLYGDRGLRRKEWVKGHGWLRFPDDRLVLIAEALS